eukprot:comp21868_c2_seq1/m.31277 comp21868_c2_seq1/g.31277  ORF comp21868_c2_seq1/g.31277 comp21868_c2_seq1/m.31277 type:complete len:423 (-) comp21868_c2_seq1:79-1347(-)
MDGGLSDAVALAKAQAAQAAAAKQAAKDQQNASTPTPTLTAHQNGETAPPATAAMPQPAAATPQTATATQAAAPPPPTAEVKTVELRKANNTLGLSVGGGAPLCPCLYVARIYPGEPASQQHLLEVGDELVAVNGQSLSGMSRDQAAEVMRQAGNIVRISYIKFDTNSVEETFDLRFNVGVNTLIVGMAELMGKDAVDSFQLHEQVELESDDLLRQLEQFKRTNDSHRALPRQLLMYKNAVADMADSHKQLAECLIAEVAKQTDQSLFKCAEKTAAAHKGTQKALDVVVAAMHPFYDSMETLADKALGDYQMTLDKYFAVRKGHVALSMAIRELDVEEKAVADRNGRLERCSTGNIKYRKLLRMKEATKAKMMDLQDDIGVKLGLLHRKIGDTFTSRVWGMLEGLAHQHAEMARLYAEAVRQ